MALSAEGEVLMMQYLPYIVVMSLVTYLIRMLPLTLFRKEWKNPFLLSFLYYVPYAVLGAMTFPAIFTATGDYVSSLVAAGAAILLAYRGKGLVTVAIAACLCAYLMILLFHG